MAAHVRDMCGLRTKATVIRNTHGRVRDICDPHAAQGGIGEAACTQDASMDGHRAEDDDVETHPHPIAESLNLHSWLVRAAVDMLSLGFLIDKMGSPILPTSLGGMRIG